MPLGLNQQGRFDVPPAEAARREAMARENGFPSYEAMLLYAGQRSRKRAPQTVGERNIPVNELRSPVNSSQVPQDQGMSWPASVFNRISEALRGSR